MSDAYGGKLRTFGQKKAGTSTFSNPSLVSPTTPTLTNPVRGFGLPTNNVIQTATEESTNLQEAQAANEQSLLSEAIHQRSFGHDISRIALRRPQAKPRFDADFSQARVHTGGEAVQMNQDLNAQAFTHKQDVYFGAEKAPVKDALTAHELTHLVQQSEIVNQKSIQRAATNLVQRDKTSERLKDLETRTKVLENKTSATQLDLKYRALFGEKTSTYKQIVYRLTGAFQSALSGYQNAHSKQAAQDAVIDQIVTTIILVAGASALEPFLCFGLGKLQAKLSKASQRIAKVNIKDDVVEKLENPINVAASGAGNTVTTRRAGERAANAQAGGLPAGGGGGTGGGDPLSFLASNMEAIESHTQKFEAAFSNRATQYDAMTTPAMWDSWNKVTQEAEYSTLLKDLDTVALGDIAKLEGAQTLAVKIELYLWATWIKTHQPGVKGLQIGSELAKRLKNLGVESLADVRFDTKSWIFMDHQPKGKWESNLHSWAQGWSQPLTK